MCVRGFDRELTAPFGEVICYGFLNCGFCWRHDEDRLDALVNMKD